MASIAFVFAGQGAQYSGMGSKIYEGSPAARRVFDRAEALRPGTLEMCFHGAPEELNRTIHTQPCLFAMDCACAAAAEEAGTRADRCAGFSLGELAAAQFAGVMDFDEAFALVLRRAELMQACAEETRGAMGAVLRLSDAQVEAICAEFSGAAYPVNYNCPGQIVVACREEAFGALSARVASTGGRMMRLKVSGAFHTPWMERASLGLREYLAGAKCNQPRIPIYANVHARPYADDGAELLARQVSTPVRWQQSVENMYRDMGGAALFVELGAGKTLSGLIRKTLPQAQVCNVETMDDIPKLKEALANVQ